MKVLNSSVLIVKPRKVLVDWVNSLGIPPLTLEECQHDCTAYLIPEFGTDEEQDSYLKDHFLAIFEEVLASWSQDENTWPAKRNFKTFKKWFEVSFHSMVMELESGPLESESSDPQVTRKGKGRRKKKYWN